MKATPRRRRTAPVLAFRNPRTRTPEDQITLSATRKLARLAQLHPAGAQFIESVIDDWLQARDDGEGA